MAVCLLVLPGTWYLGNVHVYALENGYVYVVLLVTFNNIIRYYILYINCCYLGGREQAHTPGETPRADVRPRLNLYYNIHK